MSPGKLADQLPGCTGTRNLSDNLSDLKAQVCGVVHAFFRHTLSLGFNLVHIARAAVCAGQLARHVQCVSMQCAPRPAVPLSLPL